MREPERRLAAIMFTDIVGFTRMAQGNESRTMELLADHERSVRSVIRAHGGREVKSMGDSFLVDFPSALGAVRCALAIQEELHGRNAGKPPGEKLQARIGIHVGDVIDRGGDILGDAVNIASRVEPFAQPDGVCISGQVFDQVRNKIEPEPVRLETGALKNVNLPIEVYRIVMPWELNSAGGADLDRRRIAVIPLTNMSPDPNDEYFADGMTEELITSLAGIRGLTVIARTLVMQYKKVHKKVSEIGRELGAGMLIEGSVRKAANKVRITVQLIDAQTDGHIWAQSYDKPLDDVFAIQSEIAEKVAQMLRVKLLDSDRARLERTLTTNMEAYTLYLKGRHYWNERTRAGLEKAIEYFNAAIKLDPAFALGYSGLADCYGVMAKNGLADAESSFRKSYDFASRALELDDRLAEPHATLAGLLLYFERNPAKAEAEYKKAIELNPNYASAHQWYTHLLGPQRRFDESTRELKRALELDPLSLVINVNLGDAHYYNGDFDTAIAQFLKVIEIDPAFPPTYPSLVQAYLRKSMFAEAQQAVEVYGDLTKAPVEKRVLTAYVCAAMGKVGEAHKLMEGVDDEYRGEHVRPYFISLVYFLLGEDESGFEWLRRAYAEYDGNLYSMTIDYELDRLRSDPRYLSLAASLGLAPPSNRE